MKKLLLFSCIAFGIFLLSNCSATKKAQAAKTTYTTNIQPLITTTCAPCHVPSKGGRMKALDTYEGAKEEADDMIARIQLHPGDKGYMPFKRPRLSDSTIAVFKKWKDDGLMQ